MDYCLPQIFLQGKVQQHDLMAWKEGQETGCSACFLVEVNCPQTGLHRILGSFQNLEFANPWQANPSNTPLSSFSRFLDGKLLKICWHARASLAQEEGVLANLLGRLVVTDEQCSKPFF